MDRPREVIEQDIQECLTVLSTLTSELRTAMDTSERQINLLGLQIRLLADARGVSGTTTMHVEPVAEGVRRVLAELNVDR